VGVAVGKGVSVGSSVLVGRGVSVGGRAVLLGTITTGDVALGRTIGVP
jgi:UDP-3-O-[3-hydroxymyristoyl] glucosamine N-acyltransferase